MTDQRTLREPAQPQRAGPKHRAAPPPPGALRARVITLSSGSLVRNSVLQMSSTVANSLLGYVFWVIASRLYPAKEVGAASAVVAGITLAALLSDLGLRTVVIHSLPGTRELKPWSRIVTMSLVVAAGVATIGGAAAWGVLSVASPAVATFLGSGWGIVVIVATVANTLSLLLDGISLAERRSEKQFSRALINMTLKAALLAVLAIGFHAPGQVMIAATGAGFAAAVIYGIIRQLGQLRPGWQADIRSVPATFNEHRHHLASHHLLNVTGQLPPFAIPLIVVALVGPTQTAYMSLTWMLGSAFFMVSPAVASALFAQGRWEPEAMQSTVRQASLIIAALLTPAAIITIVLGREILSIFGGAYASNGYTLLVLLAVSALPDAITNVQIGKLRAAGDVWSGARLNLVIAITAVVAVAVLVRPIGINGVGWAWILAQTVGCGVLAVRVMTQRRKGNTAGEPRT